MSCGGIMSLQITYPASKRSEIFEQMHEATNWYTIEQDDWHLPATKEAHEWCGKWSTVGCLNVIAYKGTFAEGKGFVKTFQRSCYRADCEICYKKWNSRESNKATKRIETYSKNTKKYPKHIIISPPHWLHYTTKQQLAKQCYSILKELGCIGGTLIFHPFRYHKDSKQWYYSPHFHVIGFGWLENIVENYQKNGWIVKNKGYRESTFATFYYQLSHAGIKKRNHTLTWFGDLSYSKLKVEKEEIEANICPYCNGKLRQVESYGVFYCKPPDVELELLVDLEGWRYVENKPIERTLMTKEECYEKSLNRLLYIANSGVVIS